MPVRPLAEADIPQVTELYWRYMRRKEGNPPPDLESFLRDLYFTNPWIDSQFPSLVYEGTNGKVVGFLGVIPRKMSHAGRAVRVGFGGNFVVHPESRSQLAGPRLLGSYMHGNYDVWQTDSANDVSRKLLESLGFRTIPALNIHWGRPLRPGHYGVYTLARTMKPATAASLRLASKPFCALADGLASRLPFSPFHQKKPQLHGAETDVQTLMECLKQQSSNFSLVPDYDIASLTWLLKFMDRRPTRGPLRKIVVRDDKGNIVGWYLYYVKRGGIGEVAQIGGEQEFTREVLAHLFYDAWEQGVIALHGVVDLRRVPLFSDEGCFFTCRGGWTVTRSRTPEIMETLERGNALLTRLDGEWCLDPGD